MMLEFFWRAGQRTGDEQHGAQPAGAGRCRAVCREAAGKESGGGGAGGVKKAISYPLSDDRGRVGLPERGPHPSGTSDS
jgi:hypothetical protein